MAGSSSIGRTVVMPAVFRTAAIGYCIAGVAAVVTKMSRLCNSPCGTFLHAPVSNLPREIHMAMSLGKAEINVTPLIDAPGPDHHFMVVLPQHSAGLPAVAPQPAPPDAESIPKDQNIIVSVNKDRSIEMNQQ